MADETKKRTPNAPASMGKVKITTMGTFPDEPDAGLTVNEAFDGTLAYALAMRGYDVTLNQPTPLAIEKRKREHEAWKAKREKRKTEAR